MINNIETCSPEGENPQPADESQCLYEDFLFSRHVMDLVKDHGTNHAAEPFFLCYAPHIAHEPLQVPKAYENNFSHIDNERRRLYAAMVYLLDEQMGILVNQLKQANMWDNTVFVFASDNGGPIYRYGTPGGNNNPLRGGKASNFEGGIRVPAFVSGGYLPEKARGTKKAGLSALWDWYATFAAIGDIDPYDARAALAQLPKVDSVNLWPYISGETDVPPRKELELGLPSGWRAVWSGPRASVNGIIVDEGEDGLWKLLINEVPMDAWQGPSFPNTTDPADWGTSPEFAFADCANGCLYNILTDPSEHVNLAAEHPDRLQALRELAGAYNGTVFSPNRGKPQRACCTTAQTTHKNFWGPFLDIPATVSPGPAVLTVV
jgi:arylsulfatase I/J